MILCARPNTSSLGLSCSPSIIFATPVVQSRSTYASCLPLCTHSCNRFIREVSSVFDCLTIWLFSSKASTMAWNNRSCTKFGNLQTRSDKASSSLIFWQLSVPLSMHSTSRLWKSTNQQNQGSLASLAIPTRQQAALSLSSLICSSIQSLTKWHSLQKMLLARWTWMSASRNCPHSWWSWLRVIQVMVSSSMKGKPPAISITSGNLTARNLVGLSSRTNLILQSLPQQITSLDSTLHRLRAPPSCSTNLQRLYRSTLQIRSRLSVLSRGHACRRCGRTISGISVTSMCRALLQDMLAVMARILSYCLRSAGGACRWPWRAATSRATIGWLQLMEAVTSKNSQRVKSDRLLQITPYQNNLTICSNSQFIWLLLRPLKKSDLHLSIYASISVRPGASVIALSLNYLSSWLKSRRVGGTASKLILRAELSALATLVFRISWTIWLRLAQSRYCMANQI